MKVNLLKKNKYKIIKIKKGIIEILKLLVNFSEINLVVVSENIIKNKPIKKVTNLNYEKEAFSLDETIVKKGTNIKIGTYNGIINLL